MLEWYTKMDKTVGELLQFVDAEDSIIVLSDHGFAYWDEVERHTLTRETPEGEIKGDHHKEAILITKNVDYKINQPQDVCHAIANGVETLLEQ